MWIEEKTVLLAQIHTQKNRIRIHVDNNRCDIGLFCCEFLDRVIFQESDRVTACGGTSFFFCRIKGLSTRERVSSVSKIHLPFSS